MSDAKMLVNIYTRMCETVNGTLKMAETDFKDWTQYHQYQFYRLCRNHGLMKFNFSHVYVEKETAVTVTLTDVWALIYGKRATVTIPKGVFRILFRSCLSVPSVLSSPSDNINRLEQLLKQA